MLMAARIDRVHAQRVRQRIRVSQLVRALQDNVLGRTVRADASTEQGKKDRDFLSDGQIRSAIAILAKALPDLQRTELTGADGQPLNFIATIPTKHGQVGTESEAERIPSLQ